MLMHFIWWSKLVDGSSVSKEINGPNICAEFPENWQKKMQINVPPTPVMLVYCVVENL